MIMRLLFSLLMLAGPIVQAAFTDASLDKEMSSHSAGFIYIWSPQMPLSDIFRADAKEVAGKLNLRYIELIDPHTHQTVAGVEKLESLKILKMGALDHFPAVVLFKDGKLLPFLLQGHEEKKSLLEIVKKQMEKK